MNKINDTDAQKMNLLIESYITEAKQAPKLFRDLAKVEQYIAESYKSRSFIEILQNADDAGASEILVADYEDGFFIANNGRAFSIGDIESICRSGSSQKIRGETIGYRGIGFKSTANLAKSITIISGNYAFNFNKNETLKILADIEIDEVPLIRIPRIVIGEEYEQYIKNLKSFGTSLSTYFIFTGIDNRLVMQEFVDFDCSSLLFLRNITKLTISLNGIERRIIIENNKENGFNSYTVKDNNELNKWLVFNSNEKNVDAVAFKQMNNQIIPASSSESIIHAFTPTTEFSGAYFKINGDYSTDPSRKNIDCDQISSTSYKNAVDLVISLLIQCIEGKIQIKGIFSPFINLKELQPSKFKRYFKNRCIKTFNNQKIHYKGQIIQLSNLRLRPEWLNFDDYEQICHTGISPLSQKIILDYPEIPQFFRELDVRVLSLNETIERLNSSILTNTGLAQIFATIIKGYSFDWTKENLAIIQSLQIFPIENQRKTIIELTDFDKTDEDFRYLVSLLAGGDLDQLLLKFNKIDLVPPQKMAQIPSDIQISSNTQIPSDVQIPPNAQNVALTKVFVKWKSAEVNVAELLETSPAVFMVNDVSMANIGYDLEVVLTDSRRIFFEVKSVKSFDEPFKITNNEYTEAHRQGEKYYLALVVMEPEIVVKFIRNPLKLLQFDKICEKWAWKCERYKEHLIENY